jgi:ribosomal protein S18 acetylase RimI-like enzyme
MLEIRKAAENDEADVSEIIKAVIAGGDTYTDSDADGTIANWFTADKYNYVAVMDGKVVGTFWLRANQPGRGSHVGNAAYMVSPDARGKGVGKRMGEFSVEEARRLGFKSMQFNFVVKSNEVAVKLWKSIGFEVIGEIPDAFDHIENGMTSAYIMYRKL